MARANVAPSADPTPPSVDADNPPWTTEQLDRAALGRRVRRYRLSEGLSIQALAARSGFEPQQISSWEHGQEAISEEEFEKLIVPEPSDEEMPSTPGVV